MEIRFAKGNWKQMHAMVVGIDNSKAIGERKRRLPLTALQRQDPLENCMGVHWHCCYLFLIFPCCVRLILQTHALTTKNVLRGTPQLNVFRKMFEIRVLRTLSLRQASWSRTRLGIVWALWMEQQLCVRGFVYIPMPWWGQTCFMHVMKPPRRLRNCSGWYY